MFKRHAGFLSLLNLCVLFLVSLVTVVLPYFLDKTFFGVPSGANPNLMPLTQKIVVKDKPIHPQSYKTAFDMLPPGIVKTDGFSDGEGEIMTRLEDGTRRHHPAKNGFALQRDIYLIFQGVIKNRNGGGADILQLKYGSAEGVWRPVKNTLLLRVLNFMVNQIEIRPRYDRDLRSDERSSLECGGFSGLLGDVQRIPHVVTLLLGHGEKPAGSSPKSIGKERDSDSGSNKKKLFKDSKKSIQSQKESKKPIDVVGGFVLLILFVGALSYFVIGTRNELKSLGDHKHSKDQ